MPEAGEARQETDQFYAAPQIQSTVSSMRHSDGREPPEEFDAVHVKPCILGYDWELHTVAVLDQSQRQRRIRQGAGRWNWLFSQCMQDASLLLAEL